jgi:hypothetical protein
MIPPDPAMPAPVSTAELTALMTLVRAVSDDLHTTAQMVATLQQAPAWVTTLEQRLASLGTPGRPSPPVRTARWWWGGVLGLGLLVGSLGGWWGRGAYGPERQEVRLLGHLDQMLAQRYALLPPGLRETLDSVYTQAGFLAPGQRYGSERFPTPQRGR